MDDFRGEIGVGGEDGTQEIGAGDGEGVALVGADEVVGGGGGVLFRGGGEQGEALFVVFGHDLLDLGEGDFEGFKLLPCKLLRELLGRHSTCTYCITRWYSGSQDTKWWASKYIRDPQH